MPRLYGRDFTKQQLLKRVGTVSQAGGIKKYVLSDGREKGVEAVEVRTGTGLMFRVLPGRGMDISHAEFKGAPLAWLSPTGETAPEYFEPGGAGWLRSFFGGLLTTCGLTYMGRPSVDGEDELGLHGRISNVRAENVSAAGSWEADDYVMRVSGKSVETRVFGEHISLFRVISAKLGSSGLSIHDTVENEGFRPEPHMLLYHINAGFPVVDEGAELIAPSVKPVPRGPEPAAEPGLWSYFSSPAADYRERVYYHDMAAAEDGRVFAAVANRNFGGGEGLGLALVYSKRELPYFLEWKMNGEGAYTVGMEPANALGEGRAAERAGGRLQVLEPGEKREYHLEISVLRSTDEIDSFRDRLENARA